MVNWLDEDEQVGWRSLVNAWSLLHSHLNSDLQSQHGLSFSDYEILVRLSETDDRRMRMSELADVTLSSRSRLSHQMNKMVIKGLVERQNCLEDRRGSYAVLTERGWDALVEAAPDHVTSVRTYLLDSLSPAEFTALGDACAKVAARLAGD